MKTLEQWFEEYESYHRDPTNKKIHKIFVPLITFSVYGLLWTVKIPIGESELNLLLFSMAAILGFYKRLDDRAFVAMTMFSILSILLIVGLEVILPLFDVCIVLFIIGWIFQYYGHRIEGNKPRFLDDLRFLLIGPLWALRCWKILK